MSPNHWQQSIVWERTGPERLVRYTCLQSSSGLFAVLVADFFYPPINPQALAAADARVLELLVDEDPLIRCHWYRSLDEAIEQHKSAFSEFGDGLTP